ncbi:MAG: glycosyltransferase [Chloroflexota bacterium]
MRILIAGQTYAPARNGQAVFTTNLAEGLARQGHQVTAIVPSPDLRWRTGAENGVQIEWLTSASLANFNPNAAASIPGVIDLATEKIFTRFRPEIIHIQDHYMLGAAALAAAWRRKLCTVGTNHFMPENVTPYFPIPKPLKASTNWLLWQWMLSTYNRLDWVTGPSRTAVKIMRQNGLHAPAQAISCGVDTQRFRRLDIDRNALRQRHNLAPEKTIFSYVGRIDNEKRLDLLIRAFHSLQRSDIQLAITGRGAVLPMLVNLVKQLGMEAQVRFLGYLPDEELPSLLNSMDVFVMPSEAELLSIASLEAMACGLPVLLAHSQALPELVTDGCNGYLFKPGDVASLAHAITLLADHPEQLARLGTSSIQKVQSHSLENTIRTYERLYENLLTKPVGQSQKIDRMPLGQSLFKRQ